MALGFDARSHYQKLPIKNRAGEIVGYKDYLPASARLMWIAAEAERYQVETALVELSADAATVRAEVTVYDDAGAIIRRGVAHKSQRRQQFADFLEKAETGAVGRALALIGYGTEAAADLADSDDAGDPAAPPAPPKRPAPAAQGRPPAAAKPAAAKPATAPAHEVFPVKGDDLGAPADPPVETEKPLSERLMRIEIPSPDGREPTPAELFEWLKAHGVDLEVAKLHFGIRSSEPLHVDHVSTWSQRNPRRTLRRELIAIAEKHNARIVGMAANVNTARRIAS